MSKTTTKKKTNRATFTLAETVAALVELRGSQPVEDQIPVSARGYFKCSPSGVVRIVVEWD